MGVHTVGAGAPDVQQSCFIASSARDSSSGSMGLLRTVQPGLGRGFWPSVPRDSRACPRNFTAWDDAEVQAQPWLGVVPCAHGP